MVTKKRKTKKKKAPLTDEQKRNSDIFRLRGFYANAKTLPFDRMNMAVILAAVDDALSDLGAITQSEYMKAKAVYNVKE